MFLSSLFIIIFLILNSSLANVLEIRKIKLLKISYLKGISNYHG